jgi:uncharacterized repeat protein (TIGR03803 family)
MKKRLRQRSLGHALALAMVALTLCVPTHAEPRYQVLHSFNGTDGSGPWGGVVVGQKGNLFGTAVGGGAGGCCGTVFELVPQQDGEWTESMLHAFENENSHDGAVPYGIVIFDAAGNLYGTTAKGGAHNWGTAFELTPGSGGWTESVVHDFCAQSGCRDGGAPNAGLTIDAAGNLYGTATSGGVNGGGVVFELIPGSGGWDETVLHSFHASSDGHPAPGGSNPYAGMILDGSGNLYGTTYNGGVHGVGAVYELQRISGGWKEIVLHGFNNNGKDGFLPGWGALNMDASGNLYGTTGFGGTNICYDYSCGTVFKLTKGANGRWTETILYDFKGGSSGYSPNAGVVMDKVGNLYGTTDYGGDPNCGCGVIYKLSPRGNGSWKYTVLHVFGIGDDGGVPEGNLVLDKKGNLYGSAVLGGSGGNGVVFELTP